MKIGQHKETITVTVVDSISIDVDEASWLREMAQHCIKTDMRGNLACERLDKLLESAGIPRYPEYRTIYGVFEDRK